MRCRRRSPARRCCPAPRRSDSLATNFAAGDTITVNGTPITFVASGATGNQLNITDSVQTLLKKIDSITGTTNPSTVSGGAITLHGGNASALTVTSSNTAAFAALGFGATVTANPAPLRVGGPPFNTATTLVAGHGRQHRDLVHRRNRYRFGARHRGGARRPVDHRSVWRARRRAGVPVSAAERRGVCGGHDRCRQSERQRAEYRAQRAHREQTSRRRPASNRFRISRRSSPARRPRSSLRRIGRPSSRRWRRRCWIRSRAYRPTRWRPRFWRCRPSCRLRIKPPRCCTRPR